MAKSKKEIIEEIEAYMAKRGGDIEDWYVGISANARERLFDDHSVDEKKGAWIIRGTSSDSVARDIEKYFLAKGAQGGTGGGDAESTAVYAYKTTSDTRE